MKRKITCRHCKEQNCWKIKDQNGVVLNKHYSSKQECIKEAERLANECGCELCICDDSCCNK